MIEHSLYNDPYNFSYESPERFTSYYYQIKSVLALKPKSVLEIGKGSGVVGYYLKRLEIDYLALDIDLTTRPDILASVKKLPVRKGSFDAILCAQVLEHLDFELLDEIFKRFYDICRRGVVISLPYIGLHITLSVMVSRFRKEFLMCIPLPLTYKCRDPLTGHKWGLGRIVNGFLITEKDIVKKLINSGFSRVEYFHNPKNPYHDFFIAFK
mgnify:CR=1 FL=1